MVAIVNQRPMTLGVLQILDAYIAFQKEVITRRTEFDLKVAKARMHILEGLIKALSILDEVIRVIRGSKNKANAIENLQTEFDFTKEQAEAIVNLQLYKLTNTDVTELEEEIKQREKEIAIWTEILENEEALKHVMKTELNLVKKEYATPRKTEIKDEVTEIKIDETSLIPKEDCIVVVTDEGYVKRVSTRSYSSSQEATGLKVTDHPIGIYEANTMDVLILFTSLGNFLYIPVYELPDLKWKDLGKHVSNIVKISSNEDILSSYLVKDFNEKVNFISITRKGMIKQTPLQELKVQRYSKPITLMKLKEGDRVINVTKAEEEIFITTHSGLGLRYKTEEVPVTSLRGSGVKAINLKDDTVASGQSFTDGDFLIVITDKGTSKRIKIDEFEITSRARKGVQVIRDVKTNPYHIIDAFVVTHKDEIGILTDEITYYKVTSFPICDRYQTGTQVTKDKIHKAFTKTEVTENKKETKEEKKEEPKQEEISLEKVDEQIMTIDDFLDDFNN